MEKRKVKRNKKEDVGIEIPLTNGGFTLVSERDYKLATSCNWQYASSPCGRYVYAIHNHRFRDRRSILWRLHRMIMGNPRGLMVDHINGNGLDNRHSNLRIATRSQNGSNRGLPANNKSGIKGVCWCSTYKRWLAQIRVNGKRYQLGRFKTKEGAALAYARAAKKYHGAFARLSW